MAGALVLAALSGCSSVPDAANPVEWYKGARDAITGADDPNTSAAAEKPIPGADQPIPNVSSVPPRPDTSTSAEREAIASSLIADQQDARRYSSEVIPRQGDVPQPPPPPRPAPQSAPAPQPQSAAPPPAPSAAAPSPSQVASAVPPPPAPAAEPAPRPQTTAQPAPPPASPPPAAEQPVQSAAIARTPPPGAPRTPPQMREVTPSNIAPGPSQPIQPSNIVVPKVNPQAPQLAEVKPYVPPPGLEQHETVFIGGSGTTGGGGAATPATFRAVPPVGAVASEVPGTHPLSAFNPANSRGSYQVATIQFADGSSRLSDRDRAVLRGVLDQHRKMGGTLRVIGHASSRTEARNVEQHRLANMKVSAERAEAVARELVRLGIRPDQLYVGAYSDADPKYFEFMPTGEAGNRRAEIFIDF